MLYGWAGVDLQIDLSRGNVEKAEADAELCRTYLGGRGVGSKILWDRVPPEVHPFSPDNPLIIGTGVLTGTICPGANRATLVTRSPQTNLQTYSAIGGFWGPELKFAGYDSLIVSGKSPSPAYIWIDDDKIELRDARHLWGKDTFETQKLIKQEVRSQEAQVMCIGVAGENRAYCAGIQHAIGASMSRAGVGAVMGDKNLKAIAVRGRKDVKIARPGEFAQVCEELLSLTEKQRKWLDDVSHNLVAQSMRRTLYGNAEFDLPIPEMGDAHAKFLKESKFKRTGCFNCQFACHLAVNLPGGQGYQKCLSHMIFSAAFKIDDFGFNLRAYHLMEKLGMDTMTVCAVSAFAIDLYQKGILTDADTGGLHLEFGSEPLALRLIEQIARREGIGDVLADGVYQAARRIGRGAERYAYHIKKLEPGPRPFQVPYYSFSIPFADRTDITRLRPWVPGRLFQETAKFKEEYVNSPFWPYPNEWTKYASNGYDRTGGDWDRQSKMFSWDADDIALSDCTGICTFWTDYWQYSPTRRRHQAALATYATGIEIDVEEAGRIAARASALIRAYNVILGVRSGDDTVHDRYFQEPAPPVSGPLDRAKFEKYRQEYYRLRGWNADGIPTRERLAELGLDYVAEELERGGILA